MRMRSVMQHSFSRVPSAHIPRSSFDRSHGHKTTFNSGLLVPVFVDEVLPGDTFSLSMTSFSRLATPLHPYMDNAFLNSFFFFVPYRLLWDNWQRFNGEQDNPGDSTDYLIPQVTYAAGGSPPPNTLYDYMGIPPNQVTGYPNGVSVSALPFRAYNLIYNEWFRDENMINSVEVPKDDGPDPNPIYQVQRRGKRHDYFTSCLPWPQKGESVTLPLGTSAPVIGNNQYSGGTGIPALNDAGGSYVGGLTGFDTDAYVHLGLQPSANGSLVWADPSLEARLDQATAATINQLRQAFQVQKLYERDARGGTRYTEIVRSHFGVISPDARLQRPEYLGGGESAVNIHTVAQTSATGAGDTPQGNLAAYGTSVGHRHGFSKSFTEHGVIIGLVCVRADLTYQQGVNRMWFRRGRFDFYWPALAHIGEQAVLNQEIFFQGTIDDQAVFGYQERFAEYRYKPSMISGEFRSTFPQSLDTWHLSQDFASLPMLNQQFIEENPPFARVVADTADPQFIGDFYFRLKCARPMPVFGVPGLIDHF